MDEVIREFLHTLYFRQFTIHTDGGRENAVVRPELVYVQDLLVAINDDCAGQRLIPYQHIAGIQVAPPTPPARVTITAPHSNAL